MTAAAQLPQYQHLVEDAVSYGKNKGTTFEEQKTCILDKLMVNFGVEILKIVPGRVSTEVDARLSFDVEGSLSKAHTLIGLYDQAGIDRKRILIKLASTWEGACACKVLEKEGIHCNLTLMFSLPQAIACAEAGATLISPFVGRILDWYKKSTGKEGYPADEDPGVLSVQRIYEYYKHFDYKTQIMGASFRTADEILHLAGCDLLTIAPKFLKELSEMEGTVMRRLDPQAAKKATVERLTVDEKTFRYMVNDDQMACEKLAEGIRLFSHDLIKLESYVHKKLQELVHA